MTEYQSLKGRDGSPTCHQQRHSGGCRCSGLSSVAITCGRVSYLTVPGCNVLRSPFGPMGMRVGVSCYHFSKCTKYLVTSSAVTKYLATSISIPKYLVNECGTGIERQPCSLYGHQCPEWLNTVSPSLPFQTQIHQMVNSHVIISTSSRDTYNLEQSMLSPIQPQLLEGQEKMQNGGQFVSCML